MLVVAQVNTVVLGDSVIVADGAVVLEVRATLFVAVHPLLPVTVTL